MTNKFKSQWNDFSQSSQSFLGYQNVSSLFSEDRNIQLILNDINIDECNMLELDSHKLQQNTNLLHGLILNL